VNKDYSTNYYGNDVVSPVSFQTIWMVAHISAQLQKNGASAFPYFRKNPSRDLISCTCVVLLRIVRLVLTAIFQFTVATDQFETEKRKLEEANRKLEATYMSLVREKEHEILELIEKSNREKEAIIAQTTKQQKKALASLQANLGAVISEKEKHITVLTARLEECASRVNHLDNSLKEMMAERQQDLRSYAEEKQQEENRHKDEMMAKDRQHEEEMDRIYERIKTAVQKKDDMIAKLREELVTVHKKIQDIR